MSQQINLFNPIFLQQKKIFAARTMAQALGLLAAGAVVIAGLAWRSVATLRTEAAEVTLQAAKKQERLVRAGTEFAPRAATPALTAEAGDAETQLASLRRVAQIVQSGDLGNTRGYGEYFRALGRQHQDGLWLTSIQVGPGTDMALQGRALTATLVPAYIGRLATEPVLRGKSFANLHIDQPAAATAGTATANPGPALPAFVEFTLQANVAEVKP